MDLKLGFVNDGNTKKSVFSFLVTTVCFFSPDCYWLVTVLKINPLTLSPQLI